MTSSPRFFPKAQFHNTPLTTCARCILCLFLRGSCMNHPFGYRIRLSRGDESLLRATSQRLRGETWAFSSSDPEAFLIRTSEDGKVHREQRGARCLMQNLLHASLPVNWFLMKSSVRVHAMDVGEHHHRRLVC